ncbi:hypothetical protein HU200_052838 [Digitaria exilis]|uniref:Uncharacterized protein n=1 Tax=Digitaria exilis TaxID=1010633 RepID=A0A835E8F1_9POAL|nr:hypothetical protein HU200_052838 [Digitaria exilis]
MLVGRGQLPHQRLRDLARRHGPRDGAPAGHGASRGGVVGGGGAGRAEDARCRLLQPPGHAGATAAFVRAQRRGVQPLQRAVAREAQAHGC